MDSRIKRFSLWLKAIDVTHSLAESVLILRWYVSGLMALSGVGYHTIAHVFFQRGDSFSTSSGVLMRDGFVLGTVGPLLIWFCLTWLAQAIAEGEKVEKALADRNRELSILNAIARTAGASLDLKVVLDDALRQILEMTDVDAGEIFLLDLGKESVSSAACSGLSVESLHVTRQFALGTGFPGQVAQSGQLLVTTTLVVEQHFINQEAIASGFKSYACVPLCAKGQVVGVLGVVSRKQSVFSSDNLDLFNSIGLQLGLAIQNAHLFENERSQRQLADTLRHTSHALNASLNLDDVLREILQQLGQVLIVDAGLILLIEGNRLVVAASRGRPELGLDRMIGYSFELSKNIHLEQVIASKSPATFCDPGRKSVFVSSKGKLRIEDIRWCLVVPLMNGEEVIGLLALEQVDHCYEQADEAQIAFAFANHAAAAIANARLYEHTQKMAVLEERDRLARDMHDGLVQTLGFLNMKLDTSQVYLDSGQLDQVQAELGRMIQVVGHAYTDLRELIVGLKKNTHPDMTLEALLQEKVFSSVQSNGHFTVELVKSPDWDGHLPVYIATQLVYIIQEALINVHKHACAGHVWVRLDRAGNKIMVAIEDDGCGFDIERSVTVKDDGAHFGLSIIRDRAESIGAQLSLSSRAGGGTCVQVCVMLTQSLASAAVDSKKRSPNPVARE